MSRKRKPEKGKLRGEPSIAPVKSPPPDKEWRRVYASFKTFLALGSIESREDAEKFADELDQEALEALRIARRLEIAYSSEDIAPRLLRHSRARILGRLRKFGRLVDLVRLDTLLDPIREESEDWFHQGFVLLDAADSMRTQVSLYEGFAAVRSKDDQGTVAWRYLIMHQRKWGLSNTDLAVLLASVGYIPDDPRSIARLARGAIRKHNERKQPHRR